MERLDGGQEGCTIILKTLKTLNTNKKTKKKPSLFSAHRDATDEMGEVEGRQDRKKSRVPPKQKCKWLRSRRKVREHDERSSICLFWSVDFSVHCSLSLVLCFVPKRN